MCAQTDASRTVYPKSLYTAFALMACTAGLLAGLSESPVMGTFVTGFMAVVVGGSLSLLASKREMPSATSETIGVMSRCAILLCLFILIGTAIGIFLRFLRHPDASKYPGVTELVNEEGNSVPLSPRQRAYLERTRWFLIANRISDTEVRAIFREVLVPLLKAPTQEEVDTAESLQKAIVTLNTVVAEFYPRPAPMAGREAESRKSFQQLFPKAPLEDQDIKRLEAILPHATQAARWRASERELKEVVEIIESGKSPKPPDPFFAPIPYPP